MAGNQDTHLLKHFTNMENQGGMVIRDMPKFDLDLYIANYKGRTRFERLLNIGQCSVPLCVDALKAAVAEALSGNDVHRYQDALALIRVAAPNEPEAKVQQSWISSVNSSNHETTKRLESELKGYKNNLIKESIRIGHRDLGEHYESMGKFGEAQAAYLQMGPDASTQFHVVDVGKHVIGAMLQKRDWAGILANCNKMVSAKMTAEELATEQPYQRMVTGLAHLGLQKYRDAARSFLDVGDAIIAQRYNDVMSTNDVAVYGGLLALATFNRDDLQFYVMDNSSFRNFLELEPHIRKAVTMFVNGRYASCLEILETYRTDYYLDVYLQKHVDSIYSAIRTKCIVHYFLPFSCVTLDTMNNTFGKPDLDVEKELVQMIKSGSLKARIDTIDKLLVAVSTEPRISMQIKGLETAKKYEKEALERIRRMSIAAAELEVKGSQRKQQGMVTGPISGMGGSLSDIDFAYPDSQIGGTDEGTMF
ncbi:26S proteasome subunit RPN7-domain-containing protein [Xylariaceae sp. FL1019]|nr:26S proteasome subunit RPN7-domain-containing protein [Xylariaceae sp. FL1019]